MFFKRHRAAGARARLQLLVESRFQFFNRAQCGGACMRAAAAACSFPAAKPVVCRPVATARRRGFRCTSCVMLLLLRISTSQQASIPVPRPVTDTDSDISVTEGP